MACAQMKVLFLLFAGSRLAAADWTAQTGAVPRELLAGVPTTLAGCQNFFRTEVCDTGVCLLEQALHGVKEPQTIKYACCCKLKKAAEDKKALDAKAQWAASVAQAKNHRAGLLTHTITVTNAPVVPGCVTMTGKACAWTTANYSCPGQPLGRFGQAQDDNSVGYQCCCVREMWKSMTVPEGGQGLAAGNVESVSVANALAQFQATGLVAPVTTTLRPPDNIQYEGIPKAVKLKFKLMQWFENMAQCPLDLQGEFPAWVGWKAVTSAAPAISTPNKGTAGQRNVVIEQFCPAHSSSEFTCVKTDYEVKARSVSGRMQMNLGGVTCSLQDISLYCMTDGFVGVRFDFAKCAGANSLSGRQSHVPSTASLLFGVSQEAPTLPQASKVGFSEFFHEVCQPSGHNTAVSFLTKNLPTTFDLAKQTNKTCFAHSGNTAHVMGKGCFEDFIFMDVQDAQGGLAMIPASDLAGLRATIPKCQKFNRPHATRQPISAPAPPISVPVPAPPAPPAPVPEDPCAPQARAARKLAGQPDPCAPQKPKPIQKVQEVPGVVVADRVCITLGGCESFCENTRCAACLLEKVHNSREGATIPAPVPNITPAGVCADFWKEQTVISLVCLGILITLLHWIQFHFVIWCVTTKDKTTGGGMSEETRRLIDGHAGGNVAFDADHAQTAKKGDIAANTEHKELTRETETQHGYRMMGINFVLQGIICFIVVHGVWFLYEKVARLFGVRWGNEWNSISVETCHTTLFGDWIAIWLMHWIGMSYYYGWKKGIVSKQEIAAPFVGERETHHRNWGTLFG